MAQKEHMEKLFEQRKRHIKYAQSIVLSQSDAEDIVQDCYEKLWQKVDLFSKQVKHQNAYFIKMLRNGCLDFLRKRNSNLEDEITESSQINYRTPDLVLENKQAMNRLERILQDLPEKQRSVFYLRDVEGFELDEISNALEISNDAVRTNLSRARKKIKTLYLNQLK